MITNELTALKDRNKELERELKEKEVENAELDERLQADTEALVRPRERKTCPACRCMPHCGAR